MTRYTHAIISRVPTTVQTDSSVSGVPDLIKCRREQEELVDVLREAGVDVIELAPEDSAPPSSLFVEDLAIVCNGTALLTRPNRYSRRKEVAALFLELGLQVADVEAAAENSKEKPTLEGSDVLFTGREFFVGLTKRTNLSGALGLARTFPEFPVTPIKVAGPQALKRHVCLAGPNVLAVGASKESQDVLKRIEREATYRYQTLTLPRDEAVNCLNVNNNLIFRGEWPEIVEKFQTLSTDVSALCPVGLGELSKFSGLLSQHCILFRRIKLLKKL